MADEEIERRDEPASAPLADVPRGPSPELTPEQVVRAQSRTVEAADDGTESAGNEDRADEQGRILRTMFAFAAPRFRRRHGDFEGMAAALTNPINRPLVEADAVERGPIDVDGDGAVQKVLARPADGDVRTYEFVLERQSDGKYEDCWMTAAIEMVYVGESPAFRRTPSVEFDGQTISCEEGATLRDVLLRANGRSPYNDVAQVANCGGNGLCGTCAVEIRGDANEPSERERQRLELPPHSGRDDLRLSCQTTVEGDLTVAKHEGVFGQNVDETASDPGDEPVDPIPDPIPVSDAEYDGAFEYPGAPADDRSPATDDGPAASPPSDEEGRR